MKKTKGDDLMSKQLNPHDPESTLGITITDTAKLMERLRHNISEGGDVGSEIGLDVTN